MSEELPQLLDSKAIQAELGITRAAADRILELVPIVRLPGLRKVYAKREDVARLLEESTTSIKR